METLIVIHILVLNPSQATEQSNYRTNTRFYKVNNVKIWLILKGFKGKQDSIRGRQRSNDSTQWAFGTWETSRIGLSRQKRVVAYISRKRMQGPNEMGRMEIRIWSWVARFYKLEQNETKVESSCGKEMMSRLFSNLKTNSLTQPMNTFCTLDSLFFSCIMAIFFPRGRNILWVNK